MLDLAFSISGGLALLGAVALAVRVDRHEARAARRALPWAPLRPPALRAGRRLHVVRFEG